MTCIDGLIHLEASIPLSYMGVSDFAVGSVMYIMAFVLSVYVMYFMFTYVVTVFCFYGAIFRVADGSCFSSSRIVQMFCRSV